MSDLNPGNVALVVAAVSTLISGVAAACVSVLGAWRAKNTTAIETAVRAVSEKVAGPEGLKTTLDQVHDKVNGAADAAKAELAGLKTEILTLRALVEAQRTSILQFTLRQEELVNHIHQLERDPGKTH